MTRPSASMVVLFTGALGTAWIAIGSVHAPTAAPIVINESPSLPKGIYMRAPGGAMERGAIVAFPQPAEARAYLASLGVPAEVRLLKRIAASGGDRVCAAEGRVETPSRSVSVPIHDRRGAPLLAWEGCRALEPGELFALGDTGNSFDSRYFGPISRAEVEAVYREVITW